VSGQRTVTLLMTLWLIPVIAAGLAAFDLPVAASTAAAVVLAVLVARMVSPRVSDSLMPAFRVGRWIPVVAVACAIIAIVQFARVSVFMIDPEKTGFSAVPSDPFRVQHNCLTSYAEAERFALAGAENIYDPSLYQPRKMGPLTVDVYHYPPPFLLLPASVDVVTSDFFALRRLWFALQALTLAGTILGLGLWIGEKPGGLAIVGGLFLMATPQVLAAIQVGNLQITAIPAAVAALMALYARRSKTGALVLTMMAASKIFPGILAVYLIAARRWAALAWCAVAGITILAATLAIFGTQPFAAFVHHELPGINDGRAFPQSERPQIVAVNQSVYGLTVRLRALGVRVLDMKTGLAIASFYGLLVVAFAAFVGWKGRVDLATAHGRLRFLCLAVGLVTLASFRSPFVGGVYGMISTFWLCALLAAGAETIRSRAVWSAGVLGLTAATYLVPSPNEVPSTAIVALSAAVFTAALGLNIYAATRTLVGMPEAVRPVAVVA
jgi:alpha-1,2-mannosyltransferase